MGEFELSDKWEWIWEGNLCSGRDYEFSEQKLISFYVQIHQVELRDPSYTVLPFEYSSSTFS